MTYKIACKFFDRIDDMNVWVKENDPKIKQVISIGIDRSNPEIYPFSLWVVIEDEVIKNEMPNMPQ